MDKLPSIKSFQVRAVRVPMREPHRTASGVITESPLVLTDIITDSGLVGHSMVFTYTPMALQPTAQLVQNFETLVQGEKLDPAAIDNKLAQRVRLLGPQGLVGMALAAIDMALWDALARLHEQPLWQLLGGEEQPQRAYAGIGYDGVDGSAQAAEHLVKLGYQGIKAKIGYPTVNEDLAVIQAMRKASGPDMAIMVDYNQSLSADEAIERLRILDTEGLGWVEEPTLAHDYSSHARIRAASNTPIQCGENWWGALDLQHAIDAQASDLVMPDVMKIGGVSGWQRASALAHEASLPVSSHLWPEVSAQLLCCTPTAHWLEYVDWWNPVLSNPIRIEQGMAMIDGALGTGVEWNQGAVEKYRV